MKNLIFLISGLFLISCLSYNSKIEVKKLQRCEDTLLEDSCVVMFSFKPSEYILNKDDFKSFYVFPQYSIIMESYFRIDNNHSIHPVLECWWVGWFFLSDQIDCLIINPKMKHVFYGEKENYYANYILQDKSYIYLDNKSCSEILKKVCNHS